MHHDLAGSPMAATDDTGALIWKEHYFPYGDRLNNQPDAAGNRQWFHAKPVDTETGLSYFGARYYDATLGRFMGVDPPEFDEGNIQSFNRYAYGNNNPYRFTDTDGQQAIGIFIRIIGPTLIANEVATSDVPIIGGGALRSGLTAGERLEVGRRTWCGNTSALRTTTRRSYPAMPRRSVSFAVPLAKQVWRNCSKRRFYD